MQHSNVLYVAECCRVLQSVLQCVTVCCSVLQSVMQQSNAAQHIFLKCRNETKCTNMKCTKMKCTNTKCTNMKCTNMKCNATLFPWQPQHTAAQYNTLHTLQHTTYWARKTPSLTHCNTLQHTATHCNTLQHSAAHCNTLQHTTYWARKTPSLTATPLSCTSLVPVAFVTRPSCATLLT